MKPVRFVTAACAAAVCLPAIFVGGLATGASASAAPLTIAYVTSETGAGASDYTGGVSVFNAALDAQNAKGGVNGHKLVGLVIDDQTNPSTLVTGVDEAISRGAIGIDANDPIFGDGGSKAAQEAGIPVTGDSSDGPEWGTQPNTNMFGTGTSGSVDPKYPVSTLYSNALKQFGKANVALYALAISPDSVQANSAESQSLERGDPEAKVVVNDTQVPYTTGTNFGTEALSAKDAGVNVVWSNLAGNDNAPLSIAFKQAGVKLKAMYFPDGYSPALIHTPAWPDVQGDTFEVLTHPWYEPDAGTEAMQSAMEKYAGWTKSDFPTFTQVEAWLGAELLIQGIQMAGSNVTHANVIKELRSIKSWNGDGLLPFNIDFATDFGHMSSPNCIWLTKAEKNGYVPEGKNPVCGTYIPGTTSVAASS